MMELEQYLMKEFVLTQNEEVQKRIEEMQGNQIQLQGNLLAVQTCLATVLRKMGEVHRFYESKLKLFEGKLDHHLNMGKATYKNAKASTELLSHDIAVVKEIAMMNKLQLETLAKDFNTHSCYRTHQAMDITTSFFNSCSISDKDDETSALDKKITDTVQEIEQKRTTSRQRKQMKRLGCSAMIRHKKL